MVHRVPEPSDETTPTPGRWTDPVLVGLVALVVYALHGFHGELNRDLGLFAYGAERVAHGVPPYADVFNSVGPLADALPALAYWPGHLVGIGPIISARLLYLAISAACCSLVCLLSRDTFGSRAAGLVAPAVFLTFEDFLGLAANGPREKTAMVLFLLAGLVAVGRGRWLAAGALTALATLTWQPALLPMVAAAVVAAWAGRTWLRPAARFVIGGAVPTALVIVYFAAEHALGLAYDGFVLVNLRYTSQPSAFTRPSDTWTMLWSGYHASLLLVVAGLVLLLVQAARILPQAIRSGSAGAPREVRRVVSIGAGALAASGWTLFAINGSPDLFVVLPFAALGFGAAAALLSAHPARFARAVIAASVAVLLVASVVESVTTRRNTLVTERADVRAVLGTQPSDARVLSIGAPEALAVGERVNPSRYQLFDRHRMLKYLDAEYPGGVAGYRRRMVALRPTFIALGVRGAWERPLLQYYRKIGAGTDWTWYISRSVGHQAILKARRAHDRAMSGWSG
jgi:hypothetical protein